MSVNTQIFGQLLGQRRLILLLVLLTTALGINAWLTMPRQEDPSFPDRRGLVVTRFPGADAETIERLVVDPLEDRLSEVDEIEHIESVARANVVVTNLELRDGVTDFDEAWDEIEDAVDLATREFPPGVVSPEIDRDAIDTQSVVVAITGTDDLLALADAADIIEDSLLAVDSVARVEMIADPGEQITVAYDDAAVRQLELDAKSLAAVLRGRNGIVAGGSVRAGGMTTVVRPQTEFDTVDELRTTAISTPSGAALPLSDVASVVREPLSPVPARMRLDGQPAVGLGIVARDEANVVAFGADVREALDELRPRLTPLVIDEVSFQPDRVQDRLSGLGGSLLASVAIVGVVLVLTMGVRLGLVVGAIIPMVILASLATYWLGGGTLQQISIAALVISLGLLVDNAIVVAENIQARIDAGADAETAAREAARSLAFPLFAATGTTLAAFIPNLIAQGPVGDFTRSLPIVVISTLGLSYVFAVVVTPTLAAMLLRPRRRRRDWVASVGGALGRLAVRRYGVVLVLAAAALVGSVRAAGDVKQQFFPYAGRNQVVIQLAAREGSALEVVDEKARAIEQTLGEMAEVEQVAAFTGASAPHFYYNLLTRPSSPHVAELVVRTTDAAHNVAVAERTRTWTQTRFPELEIVIKRLDQGPPVPAPIELRVYGDTFDDLHHGAEAVMRRLAEIPGAVDVRHDASFGAPILAVDIDDAAAARRSGASAVEIGQALYGQTLGLDAGQFRRSEDPVPVVVRSQTGDETTPASLETVLVGVPGRPAVSLDHVASTEARWRPASIRHRDRRRVASVYAELEPGVTFAEVAGTFDGMHDAGLGLPAGVDVEHGGKVESSARANGAIFRGLPVTAALLLFFLTLEFNSLRRVGVVLFTIPLAAIGVIPGLLLADQPLGFMSLLGLFALIGIVVNNAIVLLDHLEHARRGGTGVDDAIVEAVRVRTRPIALTTVTTVLGLLPLAFSESPLWPPMAWAIIAGLLASAGLSLLVVPALYRLVLGRGGRRLGPAAALAVVMLFALPSAAEAAEPPVPDRVQSRLAAVPQGLTAEQAVTEALATAPEVGVTDAEIEVARAGARQTDVGFVPRLEGRASYARLSKMEGALAPGVVIRQPQNRYLSSARVEVPLSEYMLRLVPARKADRAAVRAAHQVHDATRSAMARQARETYYGWLRSVAQLAVAEESKAAAEIQLHDAEVGVSAGVLATADLARWRARLAETEAQLIEARHRQSASAYALSVLIGRPGDGLRVGEDIFAPLPVAPSSDTARLVGQAARRRPDLAALEAQVRRMDHAIRAQRTDYAPRLAAVGQATYANPNPRAIPPQSEFRGSWLAGAAVTWGPNQILDTRAKLRELKARRRGLVSRRDALHRGIAIEVRNAPAEQAAASEAARLLRLEVDAAGEAFRVASDRYRVGDATTTEVLEAEAARARARLGEVSARIDTRAAAARLRFALGET